MYSVKNVKSFEGREGIGYNATLYRGTKRVAKVIDDASGGPVQFNWLDYKVARVDVTMKGRHGNNDFTRRCTPEEKRLVEHAQKVRDEQNHESWWDEDCLVASLVDEFTERKYWKSKCRNTIFTLHSDGEDSYRTLKVPYTETAEKWLKNKYGDDLKEIINKRFVEKVTA
jgi:hypothetical protein